MDRQMDYVVDNPELAEGQSQQHHSGCPYMAHDPTGNMSLPTQARPPSHYDPVHSVSQTWLGVTQNTSPFQWQSPSGPVHAQTSSHQRLSSAIPRQEHIYFYDRGSPMPPAGSYLGNAGQEPFGNLPPLQMQRPYPPNNRYSGSAIPPPSQPPSSLFPGLPNPRNGTFTASAPQQTLPIPAPHMSAPPTNEPTRQATLTDTPEQVATHPAPQNVPTSGALGGPQPGHQQNSGLYHHPTITSLPPHQSHRNQQRTAGFDEGWAYGQQRQTFPERRLAGLSGNPGPSVHSSDHPPPLISAAESRRRTQAPRFRRSRVYSSSSDRDRDSDDELADPAVFDHIIASSMRAGGDDVRAAQFIRGSVSTKMVASPSAIRSLQSVQIEDLAESERQCVICYNDYGVETPEGHKEAPLRLPTCKHVFGDHCIKKWFEESDSCPYCRAKLPAEPRITANGRAFFNIMRMRGGQGAVPHPNTVPHEVFLRALEGDFVPPGGPASRHLPGWDRRSPPTDNSEPRRRLRARYANPAPRSSGSPPSGRPSSFSEVYGTTSHTRQPVTPPRDRANQQQYASAGWNSASPRRPSANGMTGRSAMGYVGNSPTRSGALYHHRTFVATGPPLDLDPMRYPPSFMDMGGPPPPWPPSMAATQFHPGHLHHGPGPPLPISPNNGEIANSNNLSLPPVSLHPYGFEATATPRTEQRP